MRPCVAYHHICTGDSDLAAANGYACEQGDANRYRDRHTTDGDPTTNRHADTANRNCDADTAHAHAIASH